MKRIILIIYFLLLAINPCYCANYEDEFATSELRNSKQDNEVLLNDDECLSDVIISNELSKNSTLNDDDDEGFVENSQEEFKLFEFMGGPKDSFSEEAILAKIYHSKITRTDIPSFLLHEDLDFDFKNGPLKEIQLYGGYRGGISFNLKNSDFTSKYNNLTTEVGFLGKFRNENFDIKMAFSPIPKSGNSYLDTLFLDMYIVNSSIPHHKIMLGYSRVQTGMEGGSGSYILPFVNRSQIARNFGSVRSLNAKLSGNFKYIDYSLAAGSSSRGLLRAMPGAEFTGWVNVKPFAKNEKKLGKLTLGTGINSGHNRIDYTVGSFYIGYKYKKLWTNLEASVADGYNGLEGISSNKAFGWAYTAGWKFNSYLQLIGRIDQFDPNRNRSGDLKREYSIGLNWFIKGQALKVVFNYIFANNQNLPDSHKFIISTQILL